MLKTSSYSPRRHKGKKSEDGTHRPYMPPSAHNKAFINSVDSKIIDFEEFRNMDLGEKGSG